MRLTIGLLFLITLTSARPEDAPGEANWEIEFLKYKRKWLFRPASKVVV